MFSRSTNAQMSIDRRNRPSHKAIRGAVIAIIVLSMGSAACSSDKDETSTSEAISSAESTASSVADEVADAGSDAVTAVSDAVTPDSTVAGAEGPAQGFALQMKTALEGMANGGEPTVANLQEASKLVEASATVTGLEDSDGNGKDDDAKVTIEAGDDKACLQSQDARWEVTDDEC